MSSEHTGNTHEQLIDWAIGRITSELTIADTDNAAGDYYHLQVIAGNITALAEMIHRHAREAEAEQRAK